MDLPCLAGSNTLLGPQLQVESSPILIGELENTLGPQRETPRASCLPVWLFSPSCELSMSCCLSLSIVGLLILWPGCESAGKFRSGKDLLGQCLFDQRLYLLSVQERF